MDLFNVDYICSIDSITYYLAKKTSSSANKKITPVNSASPSVQMTLNPIYDEIPGQAVPQSPAPSYSDVPTLPGYFDGKIIVHTDYSYYKDKMQGGY